MENGKWKMENGEWRMENRKLEKPISRALIPSIKDDRPDFSSDNWSDDYENGEMKKK
jgi:hypothetical protein